MSHGNGVATAHANGHYYSPVCDPAELLPRSGELWPAAPPEIVGIDFNDASHRRILEDAFARYYGDFDYPEDGADDADLTHYYIGNSQFSWLDARSLFVLLRQFRPVRVIEVGSGYSSLLMADVNLRFLGGACDIRCIEPYPRAFLQRGLPGIAEVIVEKVQAVPMARFDTLQAGDLLFIDSSHVCKTGSDVNHLYFEVLPRLKPGVLVHIHDIHLPAEYPSEWVITENRSWNEQYLLRALLMHSRAFRVVFGCNYAWLKHPDLVSKALGLPPGQGYGGGSFWIERVAESA